MRNTEDIIIRSIVLYCFIDRCWLETSKIAGTVHSLDEREKQRKTIYNWLNRVDYAKYLSPNEKSVFEIEISKRTKRKILVNVNQYEALEPLLWSVGLIKELSSYDDWVTEDFHDILNIGANHNLSSIVKNSKTRDTKDIEAAYLIAKIWYWRMCKYTVATAEKTIYKYIAKSLGADTAKNAVRLGLFSRFSTDLKIDGKPIRTLNAQDYIKLQSIAYWRFYALMWLTSEYDWDLIASNINIG